MHEAFHSEHELINIIQEKVTTCKQIRLTPFLLMQLLLLLMLILMMMLAEEARLRSYTICLCNRLCAYVPTPAPKNDNVSNIQNCFSSSFAYCR